MNTRQLTYPIHEMMHTFQGEGSAMGMNAFFVRTFGCPLHCTFCDAAGTWHPEWVPRDIARLTAEQITEEAVKSQAPIAVITGGEPCIFDLEPICELLHLNHMESHLETSGAFPIQGDFTWIMLSPKRARPPLKESVLRADEFKLIIEKPEDIKELTDMITGLAGDEIGLGDIWLHPEWSQRDNKAVIKAIVDAVKSRNHRYRAGWQVHKLYQVDAMDKRSRPLVPLGGNPKKGY